jgi:hypothetical protein
MKFRIVWMGQDEEPDGAAAKSEDATADSILHPRVRYEQAGGEMVLRERLRDGGIQSTPLPA